LARRRREVQEASARRRLRWTIWVLAIAVVVGLVIAVFQSSWFAVNSISIEGAERTPVRQIMQDMGIDEGVAIVSVRAGEIEEQLRLDPWVADVQVKVVWPRSIEVFLVEYIPIARVKSGSTWIVSSGQGAVLATGVRLVEPFINIDVGSATPGTRLDDSFVLGALEFVSALPVELKDGLEIEHADGELAATVGGHPVMLGATTDMAQKAVTLAVLLQEEIPEEAVINLVSPLRPAIVNPQPEVETSQEVTTETTASG
jgi:cell division protein FtsQ